MIRPAADSEGRERSARRGGFTLLELTVVCVLLGLAAAAAVWSVRRPVAAARAELAAERLLAADAAARTLARRRGRPVRLELDLAAGALARLGDGGSGGGAGRTVVASDIPAGRFRRAGASVRGGRATWTVRADGTSPSYAVELTGGGEEPWVLVAGGTGRAVRLPDAAAVAALLAAEE